MCLLVRVSMGLLDDSPKEDVNHRGAEAVRPERALVDDLHAVPGHGPTQLRE